MKITKILVSGAMAVAMLLPLAASASTNNTFLTFPGHGANATLQAGDSIDAKATITLSGGSEFESVSSQLVDSAGNNVGIPEKCVDVNDRATAGTFNVTFPLDTIGGTEGTWSVKIRTYGVSGPGVDNNCGAGSTDSQLYTNRLTLTEDENTGGTANNTGSGSGNTSGSQSSILAAILAWMQGQSHPTIPAPSSACATLNSKLVGTVDNVYNDANVRLQGYLLSEGASIPALAAGASFGYKGPQTRAAVAWFNVAHNCN